MNRLARQLNLWMEEHRQRAALRSLLKMDDASLRDIGWSRKAILRALDLPMNKRAAEKARADSLHILERFDRFGQRLQ